MKITNRQLLLATAAGLFTFHATPSYSQESSNEQRTVLGKSAPAASRFLEVASARLGAAMDEIEIGRIDGPVRLTDLGVELFLTTAARGESEFTVVALTADGVAVDFDQARALDHTLGIARRGKMSQRLHQELQSRPASERQLVVAWLAGAQVDDLRADHAFVVEELDRAGALDRDLAELHQRELAQQLTERVAPLTRAAAARFSARGFEVVAEDTIAPIVFVRATPAELAELALDSEVESLDWAGQEYVERLNTAVAEVRASSVWVLPGGVTGTGVKVSIVEPGTICDQNPNLPLAGTRLGGFNHSVHTTGVASCVASTLPGWKGVAPGALLLSANAADFIANSNNVTAQMPGSVAAVSWSISQGAQVLNLSYGAGVPNALVSSFDKYLDYVARYSAKTIAIACGNSGGFAGDPGAGFNQLAVGAFNDMGVSLWQGETMAAFSSWMNPNTGMETPQVAAPGVNITMLTCPNGTNYTDSGTSFSSPIVAGEAALVISKQPLLGSWPEAVRAIVCATAWHNIEGAAALSSRDGTGGVDALAAWRVAGRGRGPGYQFGTLYPTSFDANNLFTAQTVYLTAGQPVRATLVFDSTVSGAPTYGTDALRANLDLAIFAPNGAQIAGSGSPILPLEITQFVPPLTGNYTIKIRKMSFTGTSEYFGTAVSVQTDM